MTKLSMTLDVQDKIDVAHFLGLQFQELADLAAAQWEDVRRYAKQGGLKI